MADGAPWADATGRKRANTIMPQVPRKMSETEILSRAIAGMPLKDAFFVREQWDLSGGPPSGPREIELQ